MREHEMLRQAADHIRGPSLLPARPLAPQGFALAFQQSHSQPLASLQGVCPLEGEPSDSDLLLSPPTN